MKEIFEYEYPIHKSSTIEEESSSIRGADWLRFAFKVRDHIDSYTIPQYGDKGSDQCTEFALSDFITQMKKYLNRHGRNSREGQDKLDLLKIAHYAQMAYDKMENEHASSTEK